MPLAFAAMMGWCGTMWPGWFLWWLIHHGGNPPPPPGPDPWYRNIIRGIIGALGGIGAATVFAPMLGNATLVETAATTFFGGVFLGSLADSVMAAGRSNIRG